MYNQDGIRIEKLFLELIKIKESIIKDQLFTSLARMNKIPAESITNRGKILLCGNGGFAADAQHLSAGHSLMECKENQLTNCYFIHFKTNCLR